MLTKKIKNNFGSEKIVRGTRISNGSYYSVQPEEEISWITDLDIQADITAGNWIINDGTSDLNATDGLVHWTALNTDCIKEIEVDDSNKNQGATLGLGTSGKIEYLDWESLLLLDENGNILYDENFNVLRGS